MEIKTADLTRTALFTAFMAVLAQIAIPVPISPVPFTLQVFGVLLAGIILPPKAAFLSVLCYLLLGAAGVPVFAAARGGLQVILGPTGGYLLGFLPGVFFLSKMVNRNNNNNLVLAFSMLIFLVIVYTCGAIQLSFVMKLDFKQTIAAGVIPYIPFDLIKIAAIIPLANKLKSLNARLKTG